MSSFGGAPRADARPQPGPQRHDDADTQKPAAKRYKSDGVRRTAPRRHGPDADAVAAALEPGLAGAGPLAVRTASSPTGRA